ncbi:hypothetical protein [Frigidibacter mobilis]|uniref:Uncharacterized protein n=1 Tax=Frigidibacter mobilis TaxID=1335048 RepID=A0A159Z838_9RHOB|nr:hypothetical protein [Frigidibacter mobilis]AMY70818.1 hypothetical protein AKL17_3594 [Frigidibacter mobilis]
MLVLEVMSLFMLGLLGAALPAIGSGDDDDDKSEDSGAEADTPAVAAEGAETEDEATWLLDYAAPEDDPTESEGQDPWELEAEDAAHEAELDEPETDDESETDDEPVASTDLDVLAAIARLTAANPAAAGQEDEADDAEDAATPSETALAALSPQISDETDADDPSDTDGADTDGYDDDTSAEAPETLTATTIVGYQPGSDQIEITIFAPPPDTAVDVVLQQTADGSGTEVLIAGKLRAVLNGVLPGDVDANDLYIEFAG